MKDLDNKTIDYFQAPGDYFWHWADRGEVIEWDKNQTIAYRDDILPIIKELAPQGLPPIGAIILLFVACKDGWSAIISQTIHAYNKNLEAESGETSANTDLLKSMIKFLDIVNQLPKDLRSESGRVHLMKEVFKQSPFAVLPDQGPKIIERFESGHFDEKILQTGKKATRNLFYLDILSFLSPTNQFKDLKSLERHLKTGSQDLPKPLPVDPLEQPEAEKSLLDELLEDRKTSGIAHLVQHLMAALHIPIHTTGTSDQSYGGISDISNRGNFDKLLLSELAYDDHQLMARLVNNEALYYRHEEPPSNLPLNRTLLIDSSIRMWGLPRHFAIAAGLACMINPRREIQVAAYSLGDKAYQELNLRTKEGVFSSLEVLNPALSCANGLLSFINQPEFNSEAEHILIADEYLLHDDTFLTHLSQIRKAISYMIIVNREGDLHFYQLVNGRKKLLTKASFDLEELLLKSPKKKKRTKHNQDDGELPIILQKDVFPLYFPTGKVTYQKKYLRGWYPNYVLGVTDDKRGILWDATPLKGGIEVIPYVEPGDYYFGRHPHGNKFYLLVRLKSNNWLKFYQVNRVSYGIYEYEAFDFDAKPNFISTVELENETVLRVLGTRNSACDLVSGTASEMAPKESRRKNLNNIKLDNYLEKESVKAKINPGYTTIQKIRSIFINENQRLCINKHELFVEAQMGVTYTKSSVKFMQYKGNFIEDHAATVEKIEYLIPENNRLKFRRASWPDGSSAIFDPRGFVHLQSSDPEIPEITIVMILQKETALWASDGSFCGNNYFYRPTMVTKIDQAEFNQNYIQPFIQRIIKS